MGGLIGPRGGLRELRCATELRATPGTGIISVTRSLSARDHVQVSTATPTRMWDVAVDTAVPESMNQLDQMERVSRTQRETLTYYPEHSLLDNMLDPDASLMGMNRWTGAYSAGARVLPGDGLPGPRFESSASTSPTGLWAHLSDVPVPHNVELTASVYVTPYLGQAAHFWVDELRMDGSTHTVHKASTVVADATNAAASTLHRLSHTITTTGETAAITFGVSRASAVVAPALTLTDHVREWGVGRGCMSALVDVTGRNPLWTATNQHIYGAADATSFTITELIA